MEKQTSCLHGIMLFFLSSLVGRFQLYTSTAFGLHLSTIIIRLSFLRKNAMLLFQMPLQSKKVSFYLGCECIIATYDYRCSCKTIKFQDHTHVEIPQGNKWENQHVSGNKNSVLLFGMANKYNYYVILFAGKG